MTVSFYGGETTGSVADRRIETAKQETTGGVGARINQDSIFTTDNDLKQDTVCFRGSSAGYGADVKKGPSAFSIIAGTVLAIGTAIGLMGLAHKYDAVSKIKNENIQKFFRHTDKITEPCHKACTWVKANCYDNIINFFRKK